MKTWDEWSLFFGIAIAVTAGGVWIYGVATDPGLCQRKCNPAPYWLKTHIQEETDCLCQTNGDWKLQKDWR